VSVSVSECVCVYYREKKKKWELLKNPTKIEEIQQKNLLIEIEPLQLAF
jgi:ribosome maturation protein Sdo1